jgi:hypothetical protein
MGNSEIGKKGIATHTLVLMVMIGFFAVIAFYLLYVAIDSERISANTATCLFKKLDYCNGWKANKYDQPPWNWYEREPIGCENLDPPIYQPFSRSECDAILDE